jgi:hypothetical protein
LEKKEILIYNSRISQQMPSKPMGHMHIKLPVLVAWQVPPFKHGFGEHRLGAAVITLPRIKYMHMHTLIHAICS